VTTLLALDHVSKRFGQVVVAEDLTLAVDAGATVGIVGPNGAGKTSLFSMISGDLRPDAGEVLFDGRNVTRVAASERCRLGVGRTYQVPRPFEEMTVFENVLVAAQQGAGERGRSSFALTRSCLVDAGLLEQANRPAGTLGLLQRNRLEDARALATRPRLLLLDEVAGGLTDPEVAELVAVVDAARARGTAIIWIEHVVRSLVGTVDRLLCLAAGALVGDGAPEVVLATPKVREVFLGTEATAESIAARISAATPEQPA
jgi:branched-chain amino acid transport system ATP-binding protein